MTAIVGGHIAVNAEAQRRGLAFPNGCLRVHNVRDARKIQRGETVVLCADWEEAIDEKFKSGLERMGCRLVVSEEVSARNTSLP